MEDEIIGQVLPGPPDHPPDSGIHKPVLVPADIDALDERKPEIPLKIRVEKRGYEPSTSRIHVDRGVPARLGVLLGEELVEELHVLELPCQGRPENGCDADGVLVDHLDRLLRVHDVVALPQLDFLELNFEVSSKLLPADLAITAQSIYIYI